MPVSTNVDDRTGQPVVNQANQNPKKTQKKEPKIERCNPSCSDIPEWLQEFKENLLDDRVPERRDSHASSSHEVSLEPTSKRSVKTKPSNDPFSRCKVCNNLATDEFDDHRIQSDYNKNCNIQKERTIHLVLCLRGEDSRHQWQRDHQDPKHLPYKAHEHWHVKWMCAQFSSFFC